MSALLGRVHFTGEPVNLQTFEKAWAALGGHGSDGSGTWAQGCVAMGYQHLEVSQASAQDRQPLARSGLIIVSDAIIDNRSQLFDRLSLDRRRLTNLPDSELILYAYRRWGSQCASMLEGDFAFAIWDAHLQRLFCARDHIGARPLLLFHYNDRLLFATDIQGLLAFEDIDHSIDEATVASFLVWPFDVNERSYFEHVWPLSPGHYLTADRDGVTQKAHWHPQEVADIRYRDHESYTAHFRELLEAAVADRIKTRYPIGSHLSGGLDSTGVTVLANRLLRAQGRGLDMTYSWAPPVSEHYPLTTSPCDERKIIGDLCSREAMSCHYGTASGSGYRDFLAQDMAVTGTADLFEEQSVMGHASQRGIRVMLSGWGGDESATFSTRGYPAYLLRKGRLLSLASMTRTCAGGLRHPRRMAKFLWQAALLPLMPDAVYDRYSPFLRTDRLAPLAQAGFLTRFPEAWRHPGHIWREHADPIGMQSLLLQNGHLASRMSTWTHWSAPRGIVYRYPLTDIRLLRFTLGLPPELLWHKKSPRGLFRAALGDILPANLGKQDIVNEKKRRDLRFQCWQLLAEDATNGAYHGQCDWVDARGLHERLADMPERHSATYLMQFIPLITAVRTWHLWQRYGGSR